MESTAKASPCRDVLSPSTNCRRAEQAASINFTYVWLFGVEVKHKEEHYLLSHYKGKWPQHFWLQEVLPLQAATTQQLPSTEHTIVNSEKEMRRVINKLRYNTVMDLMILEVLYNINGFVILWFHGRLCGWPPMQEKCKPTEAVVHVSSPILLMHIGKTTLAW